MFFAGIALVISFGVFMLLLLIKGYSSTEIKSNVKILAVAIVSMLVFARLFGALSGIYRDIGMGEKISWSGIKNTGIVFYGGLFGLLISYRFYAKRIEQDSCIIDLLSVAIPLFHAIARIGCFFGGCCFGIESESCISIKYTTEILGQINTANRIPVQLMESLFNLCVFTYLLKLAIASNWSEKGILKRYLWMYSTWRFFAEFLRGDLIRGVVCGISFGQIISVFIWLYLLATSYRNQRTQVA